MQLPPRSTSRHRNALVQGRFMATTPSAVKGNRNLGKQVESRMQEIERLADAGDWEKIEIVLHRLPGLIARIPEASRGEILLATQARVQQLQTRAVARREEIVTQLSTIKIGKRASASYQATEDLSLIP